MTDVTEGATVREDSTGRALVRTAIAHRARAQELLAEVGLHPGQEFLLGALVEHGPCAVGELADRLGVEQPTVTKTVRRLEPSGVVARRTDPDDARRTLVSVTEEGRQAHEQAVAVWDRLDALVESDLSPEEAATLRALLERVREALGGGC